MRPDLIRPEGRIPIVPALFNILDSICGVMASTPTEVRVENRLAVVDWFNPRNAFSGVEADFIADAVEGATQLSDSNPFEEPIEAEYPDLGGFIPWGLFTVIDGFVLWEGLPVAD